MTENIVRLLWDLRRAKKQGRDGIDRRKRARLAESVSGARANSPYYRELYRDLPDRCGPRADRGERISRRSGRHSVSAHGNHGASG